MSQTNDMPQTELITFGAVHLNMTNLQQSLAFWQKIGGLQIRNLKINSAEIGTHQKTLVVLHQEAKMPFQTGFSGLYHFAIHVADEKEFAKIVFNLLSEKYPFSPVDHVMSKSVYLKDPDGINIEFVLETPERFKKVIAFEGLMIEDSDGNKRPVSGLLSVNQLLQELPPNSEKLELSENTKIGHFHFYAKNIEQTNLFYQNIGFRQFNHLSEYLYADLGAGGFYQHRIALNSWHGFNKPLAPAHSAGLRHFELVYHNNSLLNEALSSCNFSKDSENYLVDPTGNKIFLTIS